MSNVNVLDLDIVLTCGDLRVYNLYATREDAKVNMEKAIKSSDGHPEQCKIMTFNEFLEKEKNHYLGKELKELKDEETYMDYIEQLPPHRLFSYANINFYDCLEAYTGSYRSSWVRYGKRFFEMMVDDYESPEARAHRFLDKFIDLDAKLRSKPKWP